MVSKNPSINLVEIKKCKKQHINFMNCLMKNYTYNFCIDAYNKLNECIISTKS